MVIVKRHGEWDSVVRVLDTLNENPGVRLVEERQADDGGQVPSASIKLALLDVETGETKGFVYRPTLERMVERDMVVAERWSNLSISWASNARAVSAEEYHAAKAEEAKSLLADLGIAG